jgi:hypothetical protein
VLVEAELAAGPKYPPDLGPRCEVGEYRLAREGADGPRQYATISAVEAQPPVAAVAARGEEQRRP